MENNIVGKSKDIIRVLLGTNVLFLIISFFYSSKGFIISLAIINIILGISFFVIDKYAPYFELMMKTQKSARALNKLLGKIHG